MSIEHICRLGTKCPTNKLAQWWNEASEEARFGRMCDLEDEVAAARGTSPNDDTAHNVGDCRHWDTYFDRTLCPPPCNTMHDRCITCGEATDGCRLDATATTKTANGTRSHHEDGGL